MRSRVVIFLSIVFLGFFSCIVVRAATNTDVFFVPHQDDEMFMAGSIARSVQAGDDVYVVLVTDGSASSVREYLNGWSENSSKLLCVREKRIKLPPTSAEATFSTSSFSRARIREFVSSLLQLGVNRSNIYLGYNRYNKNQAALFTDGTLTSSQAQKLIESTEQNLGPGTYSTLFPESNRQHPDHHALGLGLVQARITSEKKFFHEHPVSGQLVPLSPGEQLKKSKALKSYSVWNPGKGRYAIGKHSVADLLSYWSHEKYEYATTSLQSK